jgi:hypothetical protein
LSKPSNPFPEGADYPPEQLSVSFDNLDRHLQEDCPIYKERGNLIAITLKRLKVKTQIQEASDRFTTSKRFIF